ncbi:hypothetical protein C4572_03805 [Candidatus Parcubacteria bacterium]|nr:MAG: hypothetical protein C4572_03805 [Candidatus Parcubacteria bacterium]
MKKNKTLIILLLVAGVTGFILVSLLGGRKDDSNVKQVAVKEGNEESTGSDIVRILSSLEKVSLDADFFENADFLSLKDFSVELSQGDIGKANPFSGFLSSGLLDN